MLSLRLFAEEPIHPDLQCKPTNHVKTCKDRGAKLANLTNVQVKDVTLALLEHGESRTGLKFKLLQISAGRMKDCPAHTFNDDKPFFRRALCDQSSGKDL